MRIEIREGGVEVDKPLRTHVDRLLSYALARFGERIGRVVVRFSRASADPDGREKRCQIQVALRPHNVRVEDIDADLFMAVDRAAGRVSRTVARAVEREHERGEGPVRPGTLRGRQT